jgi:hypothetical protein
MTELSRDGLGLRQTAGSTKEEAAMATDWYMEGPWFKNCNCDPGCPCDFNQNPTQGYCEGMVAMRIDKGHFGDVDLSGVKWGGLVRWPGALHEGNGELQPFVDDSTSDEQRDALFQALSGQHGDTFFGIVAIICPTIHEPIVAPVDFEFDLDKRTGRIKVGDVLDSEVDTLRGIDPPDPYRVIVKIPNGFEYTGADESAETALAKRIRSSGAIDLDITDGHASMTYVRHGSDIETGARPTVVSR